MAAPRHRDRWVVALTLVAAALAAGAVVLRSRSTPPLTDALWSTALALVVLAAIGVVGQRRRAARLAWLFVVPAVLVGRLWQAGQPIDGASFGWFAYQPLPQSGQVIAFGDTASGGLSLTLAALTLVLWTLTTLGLLTLVTDARPGPVRVLAVVAAVLTVPLWFPVTSRLSDGGLPLTGVPAPVGLGAVRVAGLVLVLVVGAAVVLARAAVPGRTAAYVLPAAVLTWVWWRSVVHGSPVVVAIVGLDVRPTWVDVLPWTVVAVVETALVAVLWVLSAWGIRVLLTHYRPPEALLTP